jgi:hypothetical protein
MQQRFNYKLPTGNILVMVIAALAVPIALAYIASTNSKGLRIVAFTLAPGQANTFYWLAAALSAAAAVVAILVAFRAFQFPGYRTGFGGRSSSPRFSFAIPHVSAIRRD